MNLILLALSAVVTLGAVDRAPLHKVAVVVGANSATQGRSRLQFAHQDAQQVVEVLQLTGRMKGDDITVLEDPEPAEVLAALDFRLAQAAERPEETLLLFYYSGHADETSLFPAGKPLSLVELKRRLEDPRAAVRLGILDACRGGAWTRAKGLTPQPPFDVSAPVELGAEGSALIASSAGSESAHESDALQGSFFTHHLVAGLRGAADVSQDGSVTLQEAFEHARRMTVRDTALHAPEAQHPTFDMRLHGRSDVVLTSQDVGASALAVQERQGPLQIIQLSSGLVLVDLEPGARLVRVAVAPGRYVVRRSTQSQMASREVDVASGSSVSVDESQLTLVGTEGLSKKEPVTLPSTLTTLPARVWEWRLGGGIAHDQGDNFTFGGSGAAALTYLAVGLTDRLQLNMLSLSYRFGEAGQTQWLPWGGVTGFSAGLSSVEGFLFGLKVGAGLDIRQPLRGAHQLIVGVSTTSSGNWSSLRSQPLDTWLAHAQAGYTTTLYDTVTLSLGVSWTQQVSSEGRLVPWTVEGLEPVIKFGGTTSLGARVKPLIQVHLTPKFSLDGYATVGVNLKTGAVVDTYLLGFTWNFGG